MVGSYLQFYSRGFVFVCLVISAIRILVTPFVLEGVFVEARAGGKTARHVGGAASAARSSGPQFAEHPPADAACTAMSIRLGVITVFSSVLACAWHVPSQRWHRPALSVRP